MLLQVRWEVRGLFWAVSYAPPVLPRRSLLSCLPAHHHCCHACLPTLPLAAAAEPAGGPEGAPKGLKAVAVHAWHDRLDLAEVVEQSGTPSSARRRGKTPFQ